MLFSVSIAGKVDSSKFEYKWTVSNGKIFDGQGTTAISVLTDKDLSREITATVEINGLPEGCKNSFSDWLTIPPKPECRCNDEYGKIPWLEERYKLDAMIMELLADPKAKAYLTFAYKTHSERNSIFIRQKKILKFLEARKIPLSKILMTIKSDRGYSTAIWILPEGAEIPN